MLGKIIAAILLIGANIYGWLRLSGIFMNQDETMFIRIGTVIAGACMTLIALFFYMSIFDKHD